MALLFNGTPADETIDERTLGTVAPGDQVDGGAGNDLFIVTSGNLWVLGGAGNDTIDGSRVSGQIPVSYASAPKGIVFDSQAQRVEDGYGSVDTLIGSVWWVFGSNHADVIRVSSGQVYSLEGDDTIVGGNGVYVVPGPGADAISGTGLTVAYLQDPGLVRANLAEGWVMDGWGFRDTLSGASTILLGPAGSSFIGSTADETFEIPQGGSHTINGGGGADRLKIDQPISNYEITALADRTVFTHKTSGERLELSKLKVLFSDRTLDLSKPIPRFDYFAADQTLDVKAFVNRLAWPDDGIGASTTPVVLDLNQDGRLDFVFHLYQGQSAANWGAVTNAPTPNALMAFLSQKDGTYLESTASLFPNLPNFALTGGSRKLSVGDLNGDGKPDWAYALNREDGRSGSPSVYNTSKAVVVLSSSGPTYSVHELGEPNWYHQVLIDSTLLGQPTVIFAGYFSGPGIALQPSGANMGGGFGYQWNAATASFGQALPIPGHPNTFATLKSPAGQPQVMTVFDELTAEGFKQAVALIEPLGTGWSIKQALRPYKSQVVNFVSYSNDRGTAELFELAPGLLGTAGGYSESARFERYPGDESTAVFKFSAAEISKPRSDGFWYQDDGKAVQLIDFFRSTGDGIERLPITLINEDRPINSNFLDVLDFNADGLKDLIVYPYIEGGQPRVYLNTGGDKFVKLDETQFPMAPLSWGVSATSKFADINGDGLWDLLYFPSNGFSRSTESHLQWLTFLGRELFDSTSIRTDLTISNRLSSTKINLWSGQDVVYDTGRNLLAHTSLNGGLGTDKAVYSKARSAYSVEAAGNGAIQVRDLSSSVTDILTNFERLQFSDVSLAIDASGVGGQVYRLYKAAFDRTPDAAGVGFWMHYLDQGFDVVKAAENFLNSDEFRALYDNDPALPGYQEPSIERFVTKLYRHVLQREPEGAGYQFWVDAMNNKDGAFGKAWSRAEVLLQFADSTENKVKLVGLIQTGFEYTPFQPSGG